MKFLILVLAIAVVANCGNAKPKQTTGDAAADARRPSSGTGGTRSGGSGGTRTGGAGGATGGLGSGGDGGGAGGTDTTDADPQDAGAAPADAEADAGADADPGVPPPACDGVLPACVQPVASYARDLAPIFAAKCNNCHTPEPDKPWPLDTYLNVVSWADLVMESLAACTMPPADGGTPSLTPAEHHAISNWLACKAPEN